MPIPASIDRYRILGEIGRGAMGTVYRAHDPRLDREVAVKTISGVVEEGTQGDELTIRFEREARVAAKLRHPNVVAVYDAGRDHDRLFLVLELVDGDSLAGRFAVGAFPDRAEALEFAAQAADALAAAHAAGVIHRDIKPGNLLITRDGRVLVTDFGIAKALGETSELTRTGMVVGSPAYLSPEQVQGLPLDGRSDLFSLGVVLFEMLLRRKPFAADTFTSLVYQILTVDPLAAGDDLRTLPPALADLLRHCLAKDREHRLPDARLFAMRAREIARALPERSDVSAPTMVLASGTGVRAPAPAPAPRMAPLRPAVPPTMPIPIPPPPIPAVSPTAPNTQAAPVAFASAATTPMTGSSASQATRGPWLGFALGAVVAFGAVALFLVLREARSQPTAPSTGAPPAAPLVDTARPLDQPVSVAPSKPSVTAPPAATEPAAAAPASTATATPPSGSVMPAAAPPSATPKPSTGAAPSLYVWPKPEAERAPGAPRKRAPDSAAVPAPPPAPEPAPAEAPPPLAAPPEPTISGSFETQRAAEFHVSPEDAMVTIDGVQLGIADDWDGMGGGKEYVFPGPGTYVVRLEAEGYKTAWIRIVVRPGAKKKNVNVDTELEELE